MAALCLLRLARMRIDILAETLPAALDKWLRCGHHRVRGRTGAFVVAIVRTVAYLGLEARGVEVQCSIAPGLPRFDIVGLANKAVGESKERVRAALSAMGLALPPKRITINLSPADLPKEGSHYDLPVALALLAAMGVTDAEQLDDEAQQRIAVGRAPVGQLDPEVVGRVPPGNLGGQPEQRRDHLLV